MATLPYVTAPGNVDKALKAIKAAATPTSVSQDFVKTILKIPGGSGTQITSFLKKIGFASADGAPTDLYRMFRNPATSGRAAAKALKIGYAPLYKRNEYMHSLSDKDLRGLIIEETGQGQDSPVVTNILNCMKPLKGFATYDQIDDLDDQQSDVTKAVAPLSKPPFEQLPPPLLGNNDSVGLNLSYTINLNLPATSDVAVFNAIFKSLKENLLKAQNE